MDSFFGIGLFELILIAVIALVVLGPDRLPGAMREVAKYMRQLRQVSNEFQSQFSDELQMLDELNPKRILNDTLSPPTPKQPAQPLAPKKPAAQMRTAPPPASVEAANSILPPKVAAAPPVDPATAAPPGDGSPGAPAPQVSEPAVAARPPAAEDGQ